MLSKGSSSEPQPLPKDWSNYRGGLLPSYFASEMSRGIWLATAGIKVLGQTDVCCDPPGCSHFFFNGRRFVYGSITREKRKESESRDPEQNQELGRDIKSISPRSCSR